MSKFLIAVLAVALGTPASAATFTLDFTGTLTDVNAGGFSTIPSVSVGDTMTMSVAFDTDATVEGVYQGGTVAAYRQSVTGLSLDVGGLAYSFVAIPYDQNAANRTAISDNAISGDAIAFSAPISGPNVGGEVVASISALFGRGGQSPLDSLSMNEVRELASVPLSTWVDTDFQIRFGDVPNNGTSWLEGEFTSVSLAAVPVPASAIMLIAAIGGFAALRRKA